VRGKAAAASVVSAAMLFAPGCGGGTENKAVPSDPVRQASFRSLAARDFLLGCPGGSRRAETREQLDRLNELNRFAQDKGAMPSLQLAANDWAGLSRLDRGGRCAPGEAAYRAALADFAARLDDYAAGIGTLAQ
jgi:hypothetical protein